MDKKICVVFIFALIFFSNFIIAQEVYDNSIFGVSVEGVTLTEGWKTWGTEFKTNLLGNPVIMAVDSFFTTISPLFSILFGTSYSLSLALLLTLGLWFYFLFAINNALKISL